MAYLRVLHQWLAMNQARTSEIYRLLSYHRSTASTDADTGSGGAASGGTDNMPPASSSRTTHVDIDETTGLNKLFIDLENSLGSSEWFELNSLKELYITDTMWDDLRVPVLSTKVPSINGPGFSQFMDDGSGSTGVFLYWFDKSKEESVYFVCQMPHSWKEGSDIECHVHWTPKASALITPTDVCWGLEYTWQNINGTFGNTTIIYGDEQNNGSGEYMTVDKHYLTELGMITGTGKTLSSMLVCRLFRDATGAGGTDDYGNDAGLMEIDFHYERDSLGSKEEYVKGP